MKNTLEVLTSDYTYHIFNRANGSEQLFLSNENYRYFMQQYVSYIQPIADTFCYCLMPNHFHFLIRIKSEKELENYFRSAFPKFVTLEKLQIEKLLSKQFSNLFSSYTQAFNKQQNRMGSLFMKNFKRIKVTDEHYRQKLVHYIHYNPIEAQLSNAPQDWKYSSYSALISNSDTQLKRDEVLEWFDDLANFKYIHLYPPTLTGVD